MTIGQAMKSYFDGMSAAEGDNYAREAGQMAGWAWINGLGEAVESALAVALCHEAMNYKNGKRNDLFLAEASNGEARDALRKVFEAELRKINPKPHYIVAFLKKEAVAKIVAEFERKHFDNPAQRRFSEMMTGGQPKTQDKTTTNPDITIKALEEKLSVTEATLAKAKALQTGGLVVEKAMMDEVANLLAGNPDAVYFSDSANKKARADLRTEGARMSEKLKAMTGDEQDEAVEQLASEIKQKAGVPFRRR